MHFVTKRRELKRKTEETETDMPLGAGITTRRTSAIGQKRMEISSKSEFGR